MKLIEKFGTLSPKVKVTGVLSGNVVSYQEYLNGKLIAKGKARVVGNLNDVDIDDEDFLTDGWRLSRTGEFIIKPRIDRTGLGRESS